MTVCGHAPVKALLIEGGAVGTPVVEDELRPHASGEVGIERSESLAAGLARLREGGIDVVLLDLGVPDASGMQGCRDLTAAAPDGECPDI